VFASLLLAAAVLVLGAAGWLLVLVRRLRKEIRRAAWRLTRVSAAIGEAERAGRVRAELSDT
jgi:hypothetical protein